MAALKDSKLKGNRDGQKRKVPALNLKKETPLEDLKLKAFIDGQIRIVPALSRRWCEQRRLFEYAAPPLPKKNGSVEVRAKEYWLSKVEFIKCDLEWLLEQPHHKFWSNIVFKEDCVNTLVSFLKYAHPRYLLNEFPKDDKMFDIYKSVYHLVLCVFKRLSTIKESESQFLSKKKFAELMYDYFVFTIPRFMDICLLYHDEHRSVVTEIVTTVLEAEPKFLDIDLDEVIKTTLTSMRFMREKFFPGSESNAGKPVKKKNDTNLPLRELKVVATTLIDLFENMHFFMDIYPSVCKHFHRHSFELRLASFYAAVIPKINYNLEIVSNKNVTPNTPIVCESIKSLLAAARGHMLDTYHLILSWCLQSAVETGQENGCSFADDYTAILIKSLTETVFIRDYHSSFPIIENLNMLSPVSPEIEERRQYLLEVVSSNFDVSVDKQRKFLEPHEKAKREKAEKAAFDKTFLEVKEVFPHLEDAFLQKCLSEYQNDSQRVIHAVLENTLPKYLQKLFEQENNVAPIKVGENVPHHDSHDLEAMQRNDLDVTKIHDYERKSKPKSMLERLYDMYQDPELQNKGLFYTLGLADIFTFDDQYHYTYDSLEVAVDDSKEIERQTIVVPQVWETRKHVEEDAAQADVAQTGVARADKSEKEEKSPEKPQDAFVSKPEENRSRRNQWYGDRRQEDRARRNQWYGDRRQEDRARRNQWFGDRRPENVVDCPKGQGEDKDVTRNQDKKNAHTSTRGNYNRRGRAYWKPLQ